MCRDTARFYEQKMTLVYIQKSTMPFDAAKSYDSPKLDLTLHPRQPYVTTIIL